MAARDASGSRRRRGGGQRGRLSMRLSIQVVINVLTVVPSLVTAWSLVTRAVPAQGGSPCLTRRVRVAGRRRAGCSPSRSRPRRPASSSRCPTATPITLRRRTGCGSRWPRRPVSRRELSRRARACRARRLHRRGRAVGGRGAEQRAVAVGGRRPGHWRGRPGDDRDGRRGGTGPAAGGHRGAHGGGGRAAPPGPLPGRGAAPARGPGGPVGVRVRARPAHSLRAGQHRPVLPRPPAAGVVAGGRRRRVRAAGRLRQRPRPRRDLRRADRRPVGPDRAWGCSGR